MTSVRKSAVKELKKRGFTRQQASNAWYNQKQALRDNTDLRGIDLKTRTWQNIMNSGNQDTPVQESRQMDLIPAITPIQSLQAQAMSTTPLALARRQPSAPMTFAQAFKTARGEGKTIFKWNGKLYNTNLASNQQVFPKITDDIVIEDEDLEIPDDFKPLKQTTLYLDQSFFKKNPEIGFPMPIKQYDPKIQAYWTPYYL